jgi:hypothetical protein
LRGGGRHAFFPISFFTMSSLFPSPQAARRFLRACLPAAFLASALLLAAGCGSGSGDAQETEAGYAVGEPINGDSTLAAVVTTGDYTDTLTAEGMEQMMNRIARGRLQMFPDSVRKQVQRAALVRFIDMTNQIAEARERGINADSAAAVEQRVQRLRQKAGGDSLLQARLEKRGMTMQEVRADIRDQLQVVGYQQAVADEVEAPSAEEVSEYRTDQAREVRAERILFTVPRGAGPAQRDSVQQFARAVLDSVQSGAASFSEMARRYGEDSNEPATYQSREEMAAPFTQRGQSPENVPFVERAFALQDSGEVADEPVQAGSGYYLIKQTGSRVGTLMDSTRAVQELTKQQRSEYLREQIEQMRENATIRLNPSRVDADMTQPLPSRGEDQDQSS